jgi:peptidylprolyl isomerase
LIRPVAVVAVLAGLAAAACNGGESPPKGDGAAASAPALSAPPTEGPGPGQIQKVDPKTGLPAAPPPPPPTPAPSEIPKDTEVKTLPSGLKFSVLQEGKGGAKPKRGDRVKVHYTGWLTSGKEFDSSRRRGEPARFVLGQVIEGWNQALCEMTVGSRWKITIPPELGYGESGSPPVIPAGATLVFDVELLSFRAGHTPPPFRSLDPAKTQTAASGLRFEVLDPGTGPALAEAETFNLGYTLYDPQGNVLESSVVTGQPIQGTKESMRLPFLKEAPFLVKVGGEALCEVPPSLGWGGRAMGKLPANSTTTWRVKLLGVVKPLPVPAFEMPPADRLEKTASGLGIRVVKPGEGIPPEMGEDVVVHYAGWLTDGTLFDNSYVRAQPATFTLGGVIQGWNEGLQRLKPGGEAWLVIPPALGYGARGQGKIPANATLVFKVELLEVR